MDINTSRRNHLAQEWTKKDRFLQKAGTKKRSDYLVIDQSSKRTDRPSQDLSKTANVGLTIDDHGSTAPFAYPIHIFNHFYLILLCFGLGWVADKDIQPNVKFALYRNHFFIMLEGEASGRLLRYDPPTKSTHVVLDGLAFPNGVQLSKDESFLLFTETTNCRLMKLWLKGDKRGKVELVANLPGFPDNIRINEQGQFWVAIDCCRTKAQEILTNNPWMRSVYFRLPFQMRYLARIMGMKMYSVISLFDEQGKILDVLEDKEGVVMKLVSEVREANGMLWIGTVAHNHIATLPYP